MVLNKIMIIGNVGDDPEMRFTASGNSVTSFRVATNRTYTTSVGERRQATEWFSVVTWSSLAETCNQFVTRGMRVYVEGRLQVQSWEGQDGMRRFRPEITANTVLFLDRRQASPISPQEEEPEGESESEPDELPF